MKRVEDVVQDIYALMESKDADPSVDVEAEIDKFGEGVKALMRTEFGRKKREDNRKLRLSNIGRTDTLSLEPCTTVQQVREATAAHLRQVYVWSLD